MLKSPWTLLAGLVSRRGSSDRQSSSQSPDAKVSPEAATGGLISAPSLSVITLAEYQSISQSNAEARPPDATKSEKGKTDTEVTNATKIDQMVALLANPQAPTMIEGQGSGKRGQTSPSDQTRAKTTIAGPFNANAVLAAPNSKGASDEVLTLDNEIKRLRLELIGKLRTQNTQLKQMLKRFEPR
ncbi:hypothetical protein AB9F47_21510 [Rhizobium leguminosarum]|uniref:hypothetical protein n=1 Tax=Rhizobium leguminosarum TaxID=384 RepID=UPI003F967FDC